MFNISLDEGYQAMAADTAREAEGMEWNGIMPSLKIWSTLKMRGGEFDLIDVLVLSLPKEPNGVMT